MQLLKNHAAEAVKKRQQAHPSAFCILGRKKSIDCRIEATLKGCRRRLLSLSLNSFRLKRFACIGWFLWKKSTPETCARQVFSAERERAMFAQHDPHIISTPLFDIPIFVGEHLLTRLPSIHLRPQSPFKG